MINPCREPVTVLFMFIISQAMSQISHGAEVSDQSAAPASGQIVHERSVSPHDDEGYFMRDAGSANFRYNIVLLKQGDQSTVIRRYRSPKGHAYRLWIDDNKGTFPVLLGRQAQFDNFLAHIKRRPGKHWCEIVENPWGAWVATGPVPTGCGVQSYTQRRSCIASQVADNPCPDACAGAASTRTQSINNGTCNQVPAVTLSGQVAGMSGTEFSVQIKGSDPEGDRLQYWISTTGACSGADNTQQWTHATSATIRRTSVGRCNVHGRARDQVAASAVFTLSGTISAFCDANIWTAPDGRTPEVYAQGCNIPGTFMITSECGGSQPRDCTAPPVAVCDANIWAAPDGRTPEAYAQDCNIPGTFMITNTCGQSRREPCEGDVPDPEPRGIWGAPKYLSSGCFKDSSSPEVTQYPWAREIGTCTLGSSHTYYQARGLRQCLSYTKHIQYCQ